MSDLTINDEIKQTLEDYYKDKKPYGYTITVVPYKRFMVMDDGLLVCKAYNKMNHIEQFKVIGDLVNKEFKNVYSFNAEEHKKNPRLHYHGIVMLNPVRYDAVFKQMNKKFGRSSLNLLVSVVDLIRYNKYCEKDMYLCNNVGYMGIEWNECYKIYKNLMEK